MKVVHYDNLPGRYPLTATICLVMAMDYYNVPDLFRGIVYFILVIAWIAALVKVWFSNPTKLWEQP
jgi:hypothetical protein